MLIEIELMLIKITNIAKMITLVMLFTLEALHNTHTRNMDICVYHLCEFSVSVDKNSNVDRNELMLIKMKIIAKMITLVILITSRHCTPYIQETWIVVHHSCDLPVFLLIKTQTLY